MAKFTDKQVLELFTDHLVGRIKCDEDFIKTHDRSDFFSFVETRVSVLRDMLHSLEFYANYEF